MYKLGGEQIFGFTHTGVKSAQIRTRKTSVSGNFSHSDKKENRF